MQILIHKIFLNVHFIFYGYVCEPACLNVHGEHAGALSGQKRAADSPGTRVTAGCEMLGGHRELNQGLQQEE